MSQNTTTYLLIHGAYQGGWIWRDVAALLRAGGHRVLTPTLDGCAERQHQLRAGITTETQAEELAALLFYEDLHDVVLVGTSSGGMVLCRTGELARERISRVVFADALALFDGETIGGIVTNRPTPVTTELSVGPSREDAAGRLFAGLDPTTRDWALARYTLQPIACMQAPVRLQRFWNETWTASVIWCRQSANPPVAHQQRTADRLGAQWFELDTGHYPMLSTPSELTRLITA
jgi:pimeloyl-ACP methyl ester carboxylesterase